VVTLLLQTKEVPSSNTGPKTHYAHPPPPCTWNIVETLASRNSDHDNIPFFSSHDQSSINPKIVSDYFNKYYLSVADNIINNTSNNCKSMDISGNSRGYLYHIYKTTFPIIKCSPATTKEIEKIINNLKTNNSFGYDEIPVIILKNCSYFITSPLTYIINTSLITGTFPNRLKFSEIKPIYKKGDKKSISNYRPISLLTSFSKIFEKVIYRRLCQHLFNNNILVNEQFGFRINSSTDTAIYRLLHQVLTALNSRHNVGGIFCDLEKAFDCVNHKILLSKLEFYGISGSMQKLIISCLEGRFQRIQLHSKHHNLYIHSDWGEILHRVPQGSILGPLLFLIYMNDLLLVLKMSSTPILFADDTNVIISNPDPFVFRNSLTEAFKQLNTWFNTNLLFLNLSKTEFIKFKTKHSYERDQEINIECDNKKISNSYHMKFLGINIVNTLSWKSHIDQLLPKLSSACYAIRAIKPHVNQETFLMVYYAYFHSVMNYGTIFWGNSSYSINIFRLQKKGIRIMTSTKNKSSCRQLFKTLRIFPLQSQ
jgi:hypothetical protein